MYAHNKKTMPYEGPRAVQFAKGCPSVIPERVISLLNMQSSAWYCTCAEMLRCKSVLRCANVGCVKSRLVTFHELGLSSGNYMYTYYLEEFGILPPSRPATRSLNC